MQTHALLLIAKAQTTWPVTLAVDYEYMQNPGRPWQC